MPTDLDDLLAAATSDPGPVDVDGLWAAGRRRRRVRHAASAAGGLASIAVVAVVIGSVGFGGPATPEVSPLGEAEEDTTDDEVPEDDATDEEDAVDVDVDDPVDEDEGAVASDEPDPELPDANDDGSDELDLDGTEADETDTDQEQQATEDAGPTPDGAAMADPCAAHAPDDFQSFIDVVAPVVGQSVDGSIELVGCSRVPEGTVRYRVLDGDRVLVDSFTTATFGGPELGEFRETIQVDADGEVVLEVFWDSLADGEGERDLVRITFQVS